MIRFNLKLVAALLLLLVFILFACQQSSSPTLPPPVTQSVAPTTPPVRLKTAFIEGPTGTVDNNSITFTWNTLLSTADPSSLRYASYLQGYESDYTPFLPDTSRTFYNLPARDYTFYVKAMDAAGNIEPEPVSRSFTVRQAAPQTPDLPTGPSSTGGPTLIGGDVNRIVISGDGSIMYVLNFLGRLYRSDSAGTGWTDISARVGGGLPWVDIAVAPDEPRLVAVATDGGREVFISADAGQTFSPTGLASAIGAGRAVRCLSISPDYGSPKREIAAGVWSGSANGRVMVNILSSFPSGWFDTGVSGVDIAAIKYSLSFPADGTLVAIASSTSKTYLYLGVRDPGSNTTAWNTVAGYPVELGQPGTGSAGTPLNYADIALPSDFNGSNAYSRHIIASWSKSHPCQDVYHVFDTQAYRMHAPEPISSVAYYGSSRSGKLLLGAVKCSGSGCFQVQTYFASSPLSSMPSPPAWLPSQKPPTGSRDARVLWSANGQMAFAGTSGTEAALSQSRNNGSTWNQ